VKVTTDFSPTTEVEFESLDWCALPWVRLPDLAPLGEDELRRVHRHALRETFASNGVSRMAIGGRVLTPIEHEMRSRGFAATYWSAELWRRSNAATMAESN
jgi:hypothetical protein